MVRVSKKRSLGPITVDMPEDEEPVSSTKVLEEAMYQSNLPHAPNLSQPQNPLFRGVLTLTTKEEKGITQDLAELGGMIWAMQQEGLTREDMQGCLELHYDFLNKAKETTGENPYPTKV